MFSALLYLLLMLVVFYLLAVVCDRYFVESLEVLSQKLKLSDSVAGATLMAMGSSAPEFFTAVIALLIVGSENIGAGTIVGSAIFNILVIIGGSAMMRQAFLEPKSFWRDTVFYIIAIVILYITFQDGMITLREASLYVLVYIVYILFLSQRSKVVKPRTTTSEESIEDMTDEFDKEKNTIEKKNGFIGVVMKYIDNLFDLLFPNLEKRPSLYRLTFTLSIVFIIILSKLLVESGLGFATALGIPPVIIALTILAGGTSVPDLLSSLIVAKKGKADMAVSNAVGSNIFDILICLGFPRLLYTLWTGSPIVVNTTGLTESILILFAIVIMMSLYMVINKYRINKTYGIVLISLYIVYLTYQIYMIY